MYCTYSVDMLIYCSQLSVLLKIALSFVSLIHHQSTLIPIYVFCCCCYCFCYFVDLVSDGSDCIDREYLPADLFILDDTLDETTQTSTLFSWSLFLHPFLFMSRTGCVVSSCMVYVWQSNKHLMPLIMSSFSFVSLLQFFFFASWHRGGCECID